MKNVTELLHKAWKHYPNHFELMRIMSERVKQLGAGEMSGQLFPKMIRRALEEAAAGSIQRLQENAKKPVKASGNSEKAGHFYARALAGDKKS